MSIDIIENYTDDLDDIELDDDMSDCPGFVEGCGKNCNACRCEDN